MKALDRRVLRDALKIQDRLIGPGFAGDLSGGVNVTGDEDTDAPPDGSQQTAGCCSPHVPEITSWSCHSPLMYWNCSLPSLDHDEDVLGTINSQKGRRSSYNFTLQPLSVFAGKSFNGTQILAVDALVITIFDRSGGAVAEEFDRRSRALARESEGDWVFYPSIGSTYRSRLYEFRYQPLSMNDAWTLVSAYSLMLTYVLFSLRKLKAVKSVFGLFCTVIAQVCSFSSHIYGRALIGRVADVYINLLKLHNMRHIKDKSRQRTWGSISLRCTSHWFGKYVSKL